MLLCAPHNERHTPPPTPDPRPPTSDLFHIFNNLYVLAIFWCGNSLDPRKLITRATNRGAATQWQRIGIVRIAEESVCQ